MLRRELLLPTLLLGRLGRPPEQGFPLQMPDLGVGGDSGHGWGPRDRISKMLPEGQRAPKDLRWIVGTQRDFPQPSLEPSEQLGGESNTGWGGNPGSEASLPTESSPHGGGFCAKLLL